MEKERWKPIDGFPGYEVSSLGNIKSFLRRRETVLIGGVDNIGYHIVNLRKEGKSHTQKVHRLVAKAFVPNPNNYPEINHKDENKLNCKAENLEWCTHAYNVHYGSRTQRTCKPIAQFTKDGKFVASYESLSQASRITKITIQNISKNAKNKLKTAGGFIWRYTNG